MEHTARLFYVLDVDGVLNPRNPTGWYDEIVTCPQDQTWWGPWDLTVRLNHHHGDWLRSLVADTGGELVWGTGWQWSANDWIGPHLDLPELPWIPIPHDGPETFARRKARNIAAWTAGVPFVWFDDEPGAVEAAVEFTEGPHLVVPVDPAEGLLREHVEAARVWARTAALSNPPPLAMDAK